MHHYHRLVSHHQRMVTMDRMMPAPPVATLTPSPVRQLLRRVLG